jgi:glycosyltransferase involved in cell wall biosynthesis
MKIAILLPTKGRATQMQAWVGDMLLQQLPDCVKRFDIFFAVERHDVATLEAVTALVNLPTDARIKKTLVERDPGLTTAQAFNMAYAAANGCYDWYILAADDLRWHDGWLDFVVKEARAGAQVVGFNDGHTNIDTYAPHYMISQQFIDDHMAGEFVPAGYNTWWWDREVCELAKDAGVYAPAWSAWVEHRHPDWKTARTDGTYESMIPYRDMDKALYLKRRAARCA